MTDFTLKARLTDDGMVVTFIFRDAALMRQRVYSALERLADDYRPNEAARRGLFEVLKALAELISPAAAQALHHPGET